MPDLDNLSLQELCDLKNQIDIRIKKLSKSPKQGYNFEFSCTSKIKNGIAYCAKISLEDEDKLHREFYDLHREFGLNDVHVHGSFFACEGDIIEQRSKCSWKHDYRLFYKVENGLLKEFGRPDKAKDKLKVIEYLKARG